LIDREGCDFGDGARVVLIPDFGIFSAFPYWRASSVLRERDGPSLAAGISDGDRE
jgi:hypothetical protein